MAPKTRLTEEERLEYEQTLYRREILTDRATSWGVVLVPFALTTPVAAFIGGHAYWILGAILGLVILAWWRIIRRVQDALVVRLYRRLIQLEDKGGMKLLKTDLQAYKEGLSDEEIQAAGLRRGEEPNSKNLDKFIIALSATSRGHGMYDKFIMVYAVVNLLVAIIYYSLLVVNMLPKALQ
jgi:hypothetical protein